MERVAFGQAGRFAEERRFSPFFEDDQQVTRIDPTGGELAEMMQRAVELHVLGNIQKRAAAPRRGMQRGKTIDIGADRLKEVLLDQVRVLGSQVIERTKNHTLLSQRRIKVRPRDTAINGRDVTGEIDTLRQERREFAGFTRRAGRGLRQGVIVPFEEPDIRPHPFFFGPIRHRHVEEPLPGGATLRGEQAGSFLRAAKNASKAA